MPQPNEEALTKTKYFSLPREFTSFKLEATRSQQILSKLKSQDGEREVRQMYGFIMH